MCFYHKIATISDMCRPTLLVDKIVVGNRNSWELISIGIGVLDTTITTFTVFSERPYFATLS